VKRRSRGGYGGRGDDAGDREDAPRAALGVSGCVPFARLADELVRDLGVQVG
jgi:hypothetical protein